MPIGVTLVGRQVRAMIEAPRDGTVIASFRRSLYVRDAGGSIACFGVPGLGAGPLNALCESWPDQSPGPGLGTAWHGTMLVIGGRWQFETATASTWQAGRPRGERLAAGLEQLGRSAAHDVPARGLGRLIPALLGDAASIPGGADPFERAGFDGVMTLAACLAAPSNEPPAHLERLIGLGPGLTPSGDDAFGGALVALRGFGRGEIAARLAAWLLPRAATATSDISLAHLKAAADGEGAAALHDTLDALARADAAELLSGLRRLDAIGHSSGWDALAGAIAALAPLARS